MSSPDEGPSCSTQRKSTRARQKRSFGDDFIDPTVVPLNNPAVSSTSSSKKVVSRKPSLSSSQVSIDEKIAQILEREVKVEAEKKEVTSNEVSQERETSTGHRRSSRHYKPSARLLEADEQSMETLKEVKQDYYLEEENGSTGDEEYVPEPTTSNQAPTASSSVVSNLITRCPTKVVVHQKMRKPYRPDAGMKIDTYKNYQTRPRPVNRLVTKNYNQAMTSIEQINGSMSPGTEDKLSAAAEEKLAQIREANVQKILKQRSLGKFASGGQAAAHAHEISRYVATTSGKEPPNRSAARVVVKYPTIRPQATGKPGTPNAAARPRFITYRSRTIAVTPNMSVANKPSTSLKTVSDADPRVENPSNLSAPLHVPKEEEPEDPSSDVKFKEPKQETLEPTVNLTEETKPEKLSEVVKAEEPSTSQQRPEGEFSKLPMKMDRTTGQLYVLSGNNPAPTLSSPPVVHRKFNIVNNLKTPTPKGSQVTIRTVTVIPQLCVNKDAPGQSPATSNTSTQLVKPRIVGVPRVFIPSTATKQFSLAAAGKLNFGKTMAPNSTEEARKNGQSRSDHSYCIPDWKKPMSPDKVNLKRYVSPASTEPSAKRHAGSDRRKDSSPNRKLLKMLVSPSGSPKNGGAIFLGPDGKEISSSDPNMPQGVYLSSPTSSRSESPEELDRTPSPPMIYLGAHEPMKDLDEDQYKFNRVTIKYVKKFTAKQLRPFGKRPPGMADAPPGPGLSSVLLCEHDVEKYNAEKALEDEEERLEAKKKQDKIDAEKRRQQEALDRRHNMNEFRMWRFMGSEEYERTCKPVSEMTAFEKILCQPNALAKIPAYSETLSHSKPKLYRDLLRIQRMGRPNQKQTYPVRSYKRKETSQISGRVSGPIRVNLQEPQSSEGDTKTSVKSRERVPTLLNVVWNGISTQVPDQISCHLCECLMRLCMRRSNYRGELREYPAYRCLRKGCQTFRSIKNFIEGAPPGSKKQKPANNSGATLEDPFADLNLKFATSNSKQATRGNHSSDGLRSVPSRNASKLQKMAEDYVVDFSAAEIARKDVEEDSPDEEDELVEWTAIPGIPEQSPSSDQSANSPVYGEEDKEGNLQISEDLDPADYYEEDFDGPSNHFNFEEEEDQNPPMLSESGLKKDKSKMATKVVNNEKSSSKNKKSGSYLPYLEEIEEKEIKQEIVDEVVEEVVEEVLMTEQKPESLLDNQTCAPLHTPEVRT